VTPRERERQRLINQKPVCGLGRRLSYCVKGVSAYEKTQTLKGQSMGNGKMRKHREILGNTRVELTGKENLEDFAYMVLTRKRREKGGIEEKRPKGVSVYLGFLGKWGSSKTELLYSGLL